MKKQFIIYAGSMCIVYALLLGFSLPGFSQARLILNGASINIAQGANVVIQNPAANAITRNSGAIISEGENNVIKWYIGTTAATYTIPWTYNSSYIPVTFTTSGAAGSGFIIFSTYQTPALNSTQLPAGVTNFNRASGGDNSAFAIDRFWRIDAQNYGTKPLLSNLVFTYIDSEHTATGNTIPENGLRAQRWNNTLSTWTDFDPASNVNISTNQLTVTSVNAANFFPWWTLTYLAERHWIAASSSNWNNTANWSTTAGGGSGATVPTSFDDVFFDGIIDTNCSLDAAANIGGLTMASGYSGTFNPGGNALVINRGAALSGGTFAGGSAVVRVFDNFTLSGTAFTSPTDTLDLKSNFSFTSGSFAHNNGTVKFSGTTAGVPQDITSSTTTNFHHIYVTKVASNPGVRFQSNQNLNGVLTLAQNVIADVDGSSNTAVLTLMSAADDPTQEGAIAALPAGANISGNLTVQRFMSLEGTNNTRIYRYISSPLQNAAVSDIQNEIPITGSFTGTSTCNGCLTNPSLYYYNEAVITDTNGNGANDFSDGYVDYPDVANTEVLQPGRGYAFFVRGDLLSSARWDVRGLINRGNVTPVTLPVSFTSSGEFANDGWNLVGNPYPAPLDWNASSGWTKTNITASVYIHDNGTIPGRFTTWNGVTGTNGGSRYIAMGQGFWVKATATSPALTAAETVKHTGSSVSFFREAAPEDLLRITLSQGELRDEAVIHFREDASPGMDDHADAWKLNNQYFDISTLNAEGDRMAINSWSALRCNTSIDLRSDKLQPGNYTLSLSNLNSFSDDIGISLIDKFSGDTLHTTEHHFVVTQDVQSKREDRFAIQFKTASSIVEIREENGTLSVAHTEGIQWYFNNEPIANATSSSITPDRTGKYSVRITNGACVSHGTTEVWIAGVEKESVVISISPNPTHDKFYIRSSSRQIESVTVISPLGSEIGTVQMQNDGNEQTGIFDLQHYSPGMYLLRIATKNGIKQAKVIRN